MLISEGRHEERQEGTNQAGSVESAGRRRARHRTYRYGRGHRVPGRGISFL